MNEKSTFVKIVTDQDVTGPLQPDQVAHAVREALLSGGQAPGLLRVEPHAPDGFGRVVPAFADQPSASFRCPEHRTDEHAASDHPRFNAPVDGQALQPNPHGRTWGA